MNMYTLHSNNAALFFLTTLRFNHSTPQFVRG